MPRRLTVAGAATIVVGIGGSIVTAFLLPKMVPVFAVVGTGGVAVLGRERLEMIVNTVLRACLGPVDEAAAVAPAEVVPDLEAPVTAAVVVATEVPQVPPVPAVRDTSDSSTKQTPTTMYRQMLKAHKGQQEVSMRREESVHIDGRRIVYEERVSMTEDDSEPKKPSAPKV